MIVMSAPNVLAASSRLSARSIAKNTAVIGMTIAIVSMNAVVSH